MPWRFALDHVNWEMSNFQLAQFLLPRSICCCVFPSRDQNREGVATFVDYLPTLRNLAVNGFAVLANKCAEKDANVSRHLAVHIPVRMRLGRVF